MLILTAILGILISLGLFSAYLQIFCSLLNAVPPSYIFFVEFFANEADRCFCCDVSRVYCRKIK